MFLPLGLDNMVVKRVPLVSATLAALCVLGYVAALLLEEAVLGFAFVPAKGLAQVGWVTSMFIHGGLVHLLGNLLFFYLAGPVIEDAWGRGRFLALFLLGDVLANAGVWLVDPGSGVPTVGASGAIAACMGALGVQYPTRRVRMFYWVLVYAGTFFLPVWIWGGLWFVREVLNLGLVGHGGGIAFGAHVAGFLLGLAMALVVRARAQAQPDPTIAPPVPTKVARARRVHTPRPAPVLATSRAPVTTSTKPAPAARPTIERMARGRPRKMPPAPRLRAELASESP